MATCRIPRIQGGQEVTFSGHAQLTSTTKRQAWARPPIDVDFQVLMFTSSGLIVRFLKVFEKSNYHSVKWVRYLTKASGSYQIRVSVPPVIYHTCADELTPGVVLTLCIAYWRGIWTVYVGRSMCVNSTTLCIIVRFAPPWLRSPARRTKNKKPQFCPVGDADYDAPPSGEVRQPSVNYWLTRPYIKQMRIFNSSTAKELTRRKTRV